MDRITLQNYRCFGSEEQSARLAPLTLLVGPNSTGKTSFLALIRALWDVAFREVVPNFREHPYDLGSWDDIVYDPGGRGARAEEFYAGFESGDTPNTGRRQLQFYATFTNRFTAPYPVTRRFRHHDVQLECHLESTDGQQNRGGVRYRVTDGQWAEMGRRQIATGNSFPDNRLSGQLWNPALPMPEGYDEPVQSMLHSIRDNRGSHERVFANAPTRSSPRRTYDPASLETDPEGDSVPSYLANLYRRNANQWRRLKSRLEIFGMDSELFDEITVRSFGTSDGDPFQIQVRKHSGPKSRRRKGPWRNLIDVGYGVSQTLPLLTELMESEVSTLFLLQQPEVHLHPQAQAALGTLFCDVASGGEHKMFGDHQLFIETHSDYIIDRVRMDVRDGTTGLKPEDVSILYFEPGDVAVKIHSIRIDDAGNVKDAPEGYRQFFTDEMMRSIWA